MDEKLNDSSIRLNKVSCSEDTEIEVTTRTDSFSSVRVFEGLSKTVKFNTYFALYGVFVCRFILCIPFSIILEYFSSIGFSSGDMAEIMTFTSAAGIPGNIIVNWLTDQSFTLGFGYCFFLNALSQLLFVYGAAHRSFWTMASARVLLGISIAKIPAVRYIYSYLPKSLFNKFSFLVVGNMMVAATLAPLSDLIVGLLFSKSTVDRSMFDLNKYSSAYFVGFMLASTSLVLLFALFKNPREKKEEVKEKKPVEPVNKGFLIAMLFCLYLYETTIETYSLLFPFFNKNIPLEAKSETTINGLITLSNFFVFLFIMGFKKPIDRMPRAKALCSLCCLSPVVALLMTTWIVSNIWIYFAFYILQLVFIYCFVSLLSATVGEILSNLPSKGLFNAGFLTIMISSVGRSTGSMLFKLESVVGSAENLINFFGILMIGYGLTTFLICFCFYGKINK